MALVRLNTGNEPGRGLVNKASDWSIKASDWSSGTKKPVKPLKTNSLPCGSSWNAALILRIIYIVGPKLRRSSVKFA